MDAFRDPNARAADADGGRERRVVATRDEALDLLGEREDHDAPGVTTEQGEERLAG